MFSLTIKPGGCLQYKIQIPGDKSITHRALIISAISNYKIFIHNWLQSLDCRATLTALACMGLKATEQNTQTLEIQGLGLYGLEKPESIIDCGNAGTAMRLLTGVLSAQKFDSVITGDSSLCKRPMQRVIEPLELMGAKIISTNYNYAPLKIIGGQKLKSINYTLPIASAQIKSAILLADLYAQDRSLVTEKIASRNHTELMLNFFKTHRDQELIIDIPGDISSAAFFIVGATIAPKSDIFLPNIGLNPTRTGIIQILQTMGANIEISNLIEKNNESRGDLRIKHAKLRAITVPSELVPNAIDEFPILAIAAACADGTTVIRGAQELRHKESDRIEAIATGLRQIGINVQTFADGLAITGGQIIGGRVNSYGDHRIAMAFAMAALVAQQAIIVQDSHNIATSFPQFVALAQQAGLPVLEELCDA